MVHVIVDIVPPKYMDLAIVDVDVDVEGSAVSASTELARNDLTGTDLDGSLGSHDIEVSIDADG
jgi:hypothetical protein